MGNIFLSLEHTHTHKKIYEKTKLKILKGEKILPVSEVLCQLFEHIAFT